MKYKNQKISCAIMNVSVAFFLALSLVNSASSYENATEMSWANEASSLSDSGDWNGLAELATDRIRVKPEDGFAWVALYQSHVGRGDMDGAIDVVSRSLAVSPELSGSCDVPPPSVAFGFRVQG